MDKLTIDLIYHYALGIGFGFALCGVLPRWIRDEHLNIIGIFIILITIITRGIYEVMP